MRKRLTNSDEFPPFDESYTQIKWSNQHEVYIKYKRFGVTKEFLAYNRSTQFRKRKSISKEDILPCKRFGINGVLYRNDTTDKFIKRVFGNDNIIPFENRTPNTPNTHNKKNTQDKTGQ